MGASISSGDVDEVITDINVTPLVDVVLVVLIVFMITMPSIFATSVFPIDMPQESPSAPVVESLPIHLRMKKTPTGEIVLYSNDTQISEADLQRLAGLQKPGEGHVFLGADKEILYGEVIRVMDMCSAMGLKKISLDLKKSGG